MAKEIKNILFLIGIAVFGVFYYLDVQMLQQKEERILVELVFTGLVIFLIADLLRSLYKIIKQFKDETSFLKDIISWMKSQQALLVSTFSIYVILIPLLGFFLSTILFYIGISLLLKSRSWWEMTIIPGCLLAVIYIMFVQLLGVNLPTGITF